MKLKLVDGHPQGVVMFYPCLFCPSDNVWRSRSTDVPRHVQFFYCYYTFLDHTTKISRKVRELRHVSASGAPNNVQNCLLDISNMGKTSQHQPLKRFID